MKNKVTNFLSHLRMEGKFFFRKLSDPIVKHEHFEFILDKLCPYLLASLLDLGTQVWK